jgi:Zn-dependent oligopeptidase
MENFCWEWEVVRHMSGHVDTGAPLPRELFERMLAAKNFHAGMHYIRQLQLALFDLQLHMSGPLDLPAVFGLLQRVRDGGVIRRSGTTAFTAVLPHIASAYAASYYSYLWARCFRRMPSACRGDGRHVGEAGLPVQLGAGSSRAARGVRRLLGRPRYRRAVPAQRL